MIKPVRRLALQDVKGGVRKHLGLGARLPFDIAALGPRDIPHGARRRE